MRKKYFIAITVCCLFLSTLVSCGLSPESLAVAGMYKWQGKRNAIEYIKQKYGFTPSVIGVEAEYGEVGILPISPDPTGIVRVTMKYNDREFGVEISGLKKWEHGADSYQKPEILSAIKNDIMAICPEVEDVSLPHIESNGVYFENLFTGDNYLELIEEPDIILKLVGIDVRSIDYNPLFESFKCSSVCIIDYVSAENMPIDAGYYFSSDGYPLEQIMPYINQYYFVTPYNMDEPYFEQIYSYEYDGFKYCSTEKMNITVSQLSADERKNLEESAYDITLREHYNIKMPAGYHVQADVDEVIVAAPLSFKQDGTYMKIKPLSKGSYEADESSRRIDSDYMCTELGKEYKKDCLDVIFGVFLWEQDSDYFVDDNLRKLKEMYGNL